jgi:hypothetical protein
MHTLIRGVPLLEAVEEVLHVVEKFRVLAVARRDNRQVQ